MQNETEVLAKLLEDAEYATRHVRPEFKSYYMAIHLLAENVKIQNQGHWTKVTELCGIPVLKCSICGAEHPRRPTERFCCDCGAKINRE